MDMATQQSFCGPSIGRDCSSFTSAVQQQLWSRGQECRQAGGGSVVIARMGGGGRGVYLGGRGSYGGRGGGGGGGGGYGGGGGGYGGGRGRGRGFDVQESNPDGTIMNDAISAPILRLIDENQQMVGIVPREDAFRRAANLDLDLVLIAPDADPPVAKIMDHSKFKFEQQKKKREQQKKAAATRIEMKEIKMRYKIDVHDYEVRLKQAQKFIKDGDKVKLFMPFKGREMEYKHLGVKLLKKFEADVGEIAVLESKPVDEGRTMTMILAPNPKFTAKEEAKPPVTVTEVQPVL